MENGEGAGQLRGGVACHAHHRWMNRCHYHPRFADEEGEAHACAPGGSPRPYVTCPQSLGRARSQIESTKPRVMDSRPCPPHHAEPHLPRFILCWPFGASFGKMLTSFLSNGLVRKFFFTEKPSRTLTFWGFRFCNACKFCKFALCDNVRLEAPRFMCVLYVCACIGPLSECLQMSRKPAVLFYWTSCVLCAL